MFNILICLSLLLLLLFIIFLRPKYLRWNRMRIKVDEFAGPKGYPIVGNTDIVFFGDRKVLYQRGQKLAAEYGKFGIARGWLFHLPFVGILCPEEAEILLSSTTNITKSMIYDLFIPWLGTGLLTSTGNKWHQRRRMLTPAFHFSILKKFLTIFSKESKHLVEVLKKMSKEKEELDMIPIISKFTLNTICETAMGTPLGSLVVPKYYQSIYDIGEICIGRISNPWLFFERLYSFTSTYRRQCKIIKYLHDFSMSIINRRKEIFSTEAQENKDLGNYSERKQAAMLDILISAQKESGDIDDEGIREEVDTFMFEGHDTTSLALVHTLMLLANNRNYQDKIYTEIMNVYGENQDEPTYSKLKELKYMEMCIKEALRLYPSVPIIARQIESDMETTTGKVIPADCTAFIPIHVIHKDPSIYPNPDVFDPDRFLPDNIAKRHPFAYIPFSAGSRNCIGQKFAMLELKCAITEVLRNFILEPVDTPKTIEYYFDLLLRPAGPIRVKFVPRNS